MEKTQKINIATIIIFIMILLLPQILYFFVKDFIPQNNAENRNLAVKPNLEFKTLQDFPENYDNYFNDNLPFRAIIQELYNDVNYYIFGIKSLNNVIVGKTSDDGNNTWLFYDKKEDGDPIQYVRGIRTFNQEYKESFVKNIKENTQKLENKNIELFYCLIPNKSTIYKEMLPSYIKIKNDKNMVLDLYNYVKSQNIENIIYPYNELLEAKKIANPYYILDTHWNIYGGFIGAGLLQEKIDPNYKYLFDNAKINKGEAVSSEGDLSRMLNITTLGKFKEQTPIIENFLNDAEYKIIHDGYTIIYESTKPVIDKEIVIVGDSYMEQIALNFAKIYSKITYLPHYEYNNEKLYSLNPDIVIIEAVERYIDNIMEFFWL